MKDYMNLMNYKRDEWAEFKEALVSALVFIPSLILIFILIITIL